jgi:ribonuclease Y
MTWLVYIAEFALPLGLGAGVCYLVLDWKKRNQKRLKALEDEAALTHARTEAEKLLREARLTANQEALKLREETERSFADRRAERAETERRLAEREALLNTQLARIVESDKSLDEHKAALDRREQALAAREQELGALAREARERLQKIAGLSADEARDALLKGVEQDAQTDAAVLARRILDDAKRNAEDKAREIIITAIHRYAGEHTFENTTSTVAITGDDIKGRIIGREGRNIRAFEALTGVTVLIDDTPGAVLLSGFDPVRREIARESMGRLIADGRIHPTRIEEIVTKVTQEMDETIVRLGEEAVAKAGVPPVHPEIVKLLGRLHFRHSYSQNILDHSVEVAHLMGLMAAELGVNVTIAKRTGLFHDIGKAVNHEIEGPHAMVGAEILKRHGESDAVVNGVASHHYDVASVGPYGVLVSAADAISASRPGARSESMSTYLKRVEDLEKMAAAHPGVDRAYAVQAGRELRVFVHPTQVNDDQAFALARTLVNQIQNDLQYPGQIKVTVIRETRCVEVAK